MVDVVWLIPALPLAGFLLILLFGRKLGDPKAGYLATAMIGAAFVVTVGVFADLMSMDAEERRHVSTLFRWVPVGDLQIDLAFLADPLSITMCLFVTGIGTLIHLYAVGYMHGDERFSKFFLYLNLFALSMLVLVLGENLLVTFLGWEGVGTCSYFLISFWHERESAATAGKKAFVTNRVGDWGVMMAMFLAFQAVGTISYGGLNAAAESGALSQTTATAIAAMLFVGACGKSAQLPLYLWLPDAMEGPTPVSALIHAATMVTAGVFLMTRVNPVIAVSAEWVTWLIAIVGAATALFAATIAVAQHDIKKVLAYSTVSQLGYMFLAVGSGAYVAAIFHMVTHAFFKALLFLGSGSVIHGMHHEQDMRRMGALRKLMPITAVTFIIGWLAIAGVPPFAGFWSKDEILLYTYAKSPVLYVVGLVTALLTAYYMTRQVILVFFGEARWKDQAHAHGAHGDLGTHADPATDAHESEAGGTDGGQAADDHGEVHTPHESPWVMLFPLVVLAGLSIVGGALQLPFSSDLHFLEKWLEPVIEFGEADIHHTWAYENKYVLLGVAVVIAAIGIAASVMVYAKKKVKAVEPTILEQAWYYDKGVSAFMGGPGRKGFDAIAWFDAKVVDGAVNGVARLVNGTAGQVRKTQSGNVRQYAAGLGVGIVLLLVWFVVIRGIL
ncbi:MAG: NADH-quinone oxidoreductase subunit L [Acidimicrobiales bacterium]|nr:NADH-quinone oxidoreductase subunit L [Acidimicrobiales bacterium]MCB9392083.1 NADH-quinone oxidoreductase subunit L [Acidimicrobiaceae bacterium]